MIRIYSHRTKHGWKSGHELAAIAPCVSQKGWITDNWIEFMQKLPDSDKYFVFENWREHIPISEAGFYLCHHGWSTSILGRWDLLTMAPRVRDQINGGELTLLVVFVMEAFDTEMSISQWQDRFCSDLTAVGITRNASVRVLLGTHTPYLLNHRDERVSWNYYPFFEAALLADIKTNWQGELPVPNTSDATYRFHHMIKATRPHRHLMAMMLEWANLTPLGYCSWPASRKTCVDFEGEDNAYWNGIKYYAKLHQWMTGRRILTHKYHDSDHTDNLWQGCKSIYKQSRLEIIGETHHIIGDGIFITEKTFRAMFFGKPFVLYGCRDSMKFLQKMGYETFSSVWPETYDAIACPMENLYTVFETCARLIKPQSTAIDLLDSPVLTEIGQHNQKTFLNRKHSKNIAELLLTYVGS